MSSQARAQSAIEETSKGAEAGRKTIMISGVEVAFPFKAYPSQMRMMTKVIESLTTKQNCLLESPTGSGKSLALLCASLAWQNHEAKRVEKLNKDIDERSVSDLPQVRLEQKNLAEPLLNFRNPAKSSPDGSRPLADMLIPRKRLRLSSLDSRCNTSDSISGTFKASGKQQRSVPRIFFGTRTHKQIAQITQELRKTGYQNVRSIVLASRDHTCINPLVEKETNKNESCRKLVYSTLGGGCEYHTGARGLSSFDELRSAGVSHGYDLEDLVAAGRREAACPYYSTKLLMQSADIIFCPYNYILDPDIRRVMNLELTGHVVIFDEAHNIEDAARESLSFTLGQEEIKRAVEDCEKNSKSGTETAALSDLASFLSQLLQWIYSQAIHLPMRSSSSYGKCYTGMEFLASACAFSLTEEIVKQYFAPFQAIMAQRAKQAGSTTNYGSHWKDEDPVITSQTVSVIEKALRLFTELTRDSGRYRNDFRIALTKEAVRECASASRGHFRSVLQVHLWCLNPALAFEYVRIEAHSIVLMSGTLSPMRSLEAELSTPFPLKLETNHVIDKCQVWASVVGVGPNGVSLNGSYQNTESIPYQDEIGSVVLWVCNTMPHGVLCFFPSYRMLESMQNRWRSSGTLALIKEIKTVFAEPRGGSSSFQEIMIEFYASIRESARHQEGSRVTGALFLAVCRGKVSEGLDFADNNARAVICVGIPFPNFKDMQVELKREYNDQNKSRGLLSGEEWYEIQAFRALNQALGRCIRHQRDWGAILLIDDRYTRTTRYRTSLSKWIRPLVKNFGNWLSTKESLQKFQEQMQNFYATPQGEESMFSSQDGFEARIENSFGTSDDGKNSDVRGHSEREATTVVVPVDNSDSEPARNCANLLRVPVVARDSCPTPSHSKNESSSALIKLPSTPEKIFSNSIKTVQQQSNVFASIFAKQMERARTCRTGKDEDSCGLKNATVAKVPVNTLSETVNNNLKQPNEKKSEL